MSFMKRYTVVLPMVLAALASAPAVADVWVFEPSVTLDQRIDDNYYLLTNGAAALSATRGIAELGLSREASTYVLKGLLRADTLFTANSDVGDEDLDSNLIAAINASQRTARSRYGVKINYKRDTPSRDIAADISDNEAVASDTNESSLETQLLTSNVARKEIKLEPNFEYDLTRRLILKVNGKWADVSHELPEAQDVIYQQYIDTVGGPLAYDEVTIADVGNAFAPSGELGDYREAELKSGLRYKLTPIVTLTADAAYSRLISQTLASDDLEPFADPVQFVADSDQPGILRRFRRDLVTTTTRFTLGYERLLTPTLQFAINGGGYNTITDNSDTYRAGDVLKNGAEAPIVGKEKKDGWLANTSLTYDAGATRYTARFAVDVQPSSAGAQIETNELSGDVRRALSPRLNVALLARAFEPDRQGANVSSKFARRFISFEPRLQWQYTRSWTVTAAYRYRRQKSRVDTVSAESNAILLAIKYTPPSEIRDTARASGL